MTTTIRLLYIDDDPALSRLVQKELARHGITAVPAIDGDAGLALLRSESFDVCALDHYMPGRDGLEILPEILALPEAPPVIYVTGTQEGRVAVAALRAGAADYVIKDVSEDFTALLRRSITQALKRRRLELENQQAMDDVREARDRAEALLREVNHRVGNSLQLVSSFISLQQRQLKDEGSRRALQEAQSRIEAVAQVHRRLYTSADIATVGVSDYLVDLIDELAKSLGPAGQAPQILVDVQNLRVTPDQAVSLGVIVTELITNAVKYAYEPGEGGQIRVTLHAAEEGRALLVVEDDGPGITQEAPKGTGLGTRIIKAMAQGLKSHIEVDPSHSGVRACLEFEL